MRPPRCRTPVRLTRIIRSISVDKISAHATQADRVPTGGVADAGGKGLVNRQRQRPRHLRHPARLIDLLSGSRLLHQRAIKACDRRLSNPRRSHKPRSRFPCWFPGTRARRPAHVLCPRRVFRCPAGRLQRPDRFPTCFEPALARRWQNLRRSLQYPKIWSSCSTPLELFHVSWKHEKALYSSFDAFSSREPASTSLENALKVQDIDCTIYNKAGLQGLVPQSVLTVSRNAAPAS
jgi:hypothetical protein